MFQSIHFCNFGIVLFELHEHREFVMSRLSFLLVGFFDENCNWLTFISPSGSIKVKNIPAKKSTNRKKSKN